MGRRAMVGRHVTIRVIGAVVATGRQSGMYFMYLGLSRSINPGAATIGTAAGIEIEIESAGNDRGLAPETGGADESIAADQEIGVERKNRTSALDLLVEKPLATELARKT
jgi:hypothetical protein